MPSPEENRAIVLADAIQREAVQLVGLLAEARSEPQPPLIPVTPPTERIPYFDVGDVTGVPGETVYVRVEGGCLHPITGFHACGGGGKTDKPRSGYGNSRVTGVILGPFLRRHLKEQGAIHDEPDHLHNHYWSRFQFFDWETHHPLPEEWWEFAIGFFSLDQKRTVEPLAIPSGTHLFTLHIEILKDTKPGVYELTCLDEHYYLNSRVKRRDLEYTYSTQGFTKVETYGGKLTVT